MLYFWISLGILGGLCLIRLFIWCNNSWLKTTYYRLNANGIENDVRIVHISDLHGKSFGRKNFKLVSKIAEVSPDFIVITGDIIHIDNEKNKRIALETVASLSAVAPVLYVSGNHEMRNKGYRLFRKDLIEAGAVVLDDCSAYICGLTVVGLNCVSLKNDKIFQITPESGVKVLLAHMPQFIDKYAAAGYDFVFCGHAHGGQWRIPFTHIGIYSPGQGMFPKLTSGVHVRGKMRMVISRGLGNSHCPLRLFNRPEIVVVELKSI